MYLYTVYYSCALLFYYLISFYIFVFTLSVFLYYEDKIMNDYCDNNYHILVSHDNTRSKRAWLLLMYFIKLLIVNISICLDICMSIKKA